MTHLKRINAPSTWPVERKTTTFITKPSPGPHKLEESMPLGVILREILKIGKEKREINIILNNNKVLINNKVRKEFDFPVGIFDTLSIPDLNKHYKVVYSLKGKLDLKEVNKEESNYKICKIIGKKTLKKKKTQLNFYNGENLIIDKDNYKVRDSVILKDNKIVKHLKFEKNALIYLTGGKHIGNKGTLVDIKKAPGFSKDIVVFKIENKTHETLADYSFVLEK
ncbi:MAG: 30S ribosomal protein S4e [Nanoarchaeota archaeon]